MNLERAKDSVIEAVRENISLAEPAVFIMGFAEGVPGLSLLVPSTALFLGVGTLHAAAGGQFWHLWLAASLGAVVSDSVVYFLARAYKNEAVHAWPLSRLPDWLPRGHALFERWGVLAVVGGKFTGFMRPFVPAMAGVLAMPLWQFVPASIVSSLLWAGAFLAPGYGVKWLID
jgi:membrane protein DedA with SNARE-associated domain